YIVDTHSSHIWNQPDNSNNISIPLSHTLVITNHTPIINRTWFIIAVTCLNQTIVEHPKHHNYSIIPRPPTCVNTTIIKKAIHVILNISTPPVTFCHAISRKRRAWYDTLLGGTGTAMGVLNGVDMEILRNKLSTTASHLKTAFHVTAQWAPTVVNSQITQLTLDKQMLTYLGNLTYAITNFTLGSSDWSMCAIRYLWMSQQRLELENMLLIPKFTKLSKLLSWGSSDWIDYSPTNSYCIEHINSSVSYFTCQTSFTWYKVLPDDVSLACKFTVLPFPHYNGLVQNLTWWTPTFIGDYVLPHSNTTFSLSHCSSTNFGFVCRHSSPVYEPCLLHRDLNICNWHIYPSDYSIMIEIAPQYVCFATNLPTGIPYVDDSLPFAGCLSNLTILQWGNLSYYFSPIPSIYHSMQYNIKHLPLSAYQLPTTVVRSLLQTNTETIATFRKHLHQLHDTAVKTVATKSEIISLGSQLQQDLQHHWYDVFTGWSPT
ncbi:hypothetical protein XELAEV_18021609mg, partial [Xenopus laevis]